MEHDDPQAIERRSRSIFGIALVTFVVVTGGVVLFVIAALWFVSAMGGS